LIFRSPRCEFQQSTSLSRRNRSTLNTERVYEMVWESVNERTGSVRDTGSGGSSHSRGRKKEEAGSKKGIEIRSNRTGDGNRTEDTSHATRSRDWRADLGQNNPRALEQRLRFNGTRCWELLESETPEPKIRRIENTEDERNRTRKVARAEGKDSPRAREDGITQHRRLH
jgi:hypothetical protein